VVGGGLYFGRYLLLMLVVIGALFVLGVVSVLFPAAIRQALVDLFSIFVAAPIATFFTYELYKSATAAHHKPLES
jgi:hypothetical protein